MKLPSHMIGNVPSVLRSLMAAHDIHEAELARRLLIKQATLNTLLSGTSKDPRLSTLLTLSTYFSISLDQLAGLDKIDYNQFKKQIFKKRRLVPILAWDKVNEWIQAESPILEGHTDWAVTSECSNPKSFGLRSQPFMYPFFWKDAIVIVNHCDLSRVYDGCFIVFYEDNKLNIKQVIRDGQQCYLKAFDSNIPYCKMDENFEIIGVLVETRSVFSGPL
jgi:transcriptional regulator with XRE-family HTH domain